MAEVAGLGGDRGLSGACLQHHGVRTDWVADNPSQGGNGRQAYFPTKAPAPGTCSTISSDKFEDTIIKNAKTKTAVH